MNLKAELEVANLHRKVDRIYESVQSHWAEYLKGKKVETEINSSVQGPNDYY